MIFNLLTSRVRRLSHIRRYSSLMVIRPENVAEHSFYCALFSYAIAKDFQFRGFDVNADEAMRKALFHDLEESLTGDILRSFKYSSTELTAAIKEAGDERMAELVLDFGAAAASVASNWSEAKEGREGDIVAFCDLLCVVGYLREEHLAGNRHLDAVAAEVYSYILDRFPVASAFGIYVDDLYPNDNPTDIFRET